MTHEEFIPQEEIETVFETDRAFSKETGAQSLGRLIWMTIRLRAELTLTLFDLGIEESKIHAVVEAFDEAGEDFYDFVLAGLESTREIPRDGHPLEDAYVEAVEDVIDLLEDKYGPEDDHEKLKLLINAPGREEMIDYATMPDEELLHRLEAHKRRLRGN